MAEQGRPDGPRSRENAILQVNNGQAVQCSVCHGILRLICHPAFHLLCNLDGQDCRGVGSKVYVEERVGLFLTVVNVLYQEGGGFLLLHIERLCLALFEEQVEARLMAMVPGGSMFEERFRRVLVDDQHATFQVMPPSSHAAGGGCCLSVLDFHSPILLSTSRATPNYAHMRHLLTRQHPAPSRVSSPFLDKQLVKNQPVDFTENRNLQAKLATDKDLRHADGTDRVEKLVDLCWGGLDLPDFIAAASKEKQGGHCCLGLEEVMVRDYKWQPLEGAGMMYQLLDMRKKLWKDVDHPEVFHIAKDENVPYYENRTGFYIVRGVRLSSEDQRRFRELLTSRLQSSLFCFQTQAVQQQQHQQHRLLPYVVCVFLPVLVVEEEEEDQGAAGGAGAVGGEQTLVHKDLYVVDIQVEYFPGGCFRDPGGPEAYQFQHRLNPAASGPVRVSGVECCRNLSL